MYCNYGPVSLGNNTQPISALTIPLHYTLRRLSKIVLMEAYKWKQSQSPAYKYLALQVVTQMMGPSCPYRKKLEPLRPWSRECSKIVCHPPSANFRQYWDWQLPWLTESHQVFRLPVHNLCGRLPGPLLPITFTRNSLLTSCSYLLKLITYFP